MIETHLNSLKVAAVTCVGCLAVRAALAHAGYVVVGGVAVVESVRGDQVDEVAVAQSLWLVVVSFEKGKIESVRTNFYWNGRLGIIGTNP